MSVASARACTPSTSSRPKRSALRPRSFSPVALLVDFAAGTLSFLRPVRLLPRIRFLPPGPYPCGCAPAVRALAPSFSSGSSPSLPLSALPRTPSPFIRRPSWPGTGTPRRVSFHAWGGFSADAVPTGRFGGFALPPLPSVGAGSRRSMRTGCCFRSGAAGPSGWSYCFMRWAWLLADSRWRIPRVRRRSPRLECFRPVDPWMFPWIRCSCVCYLFLSTPVAIEPSDVTLPGPGLARPPLRTWPVPPAPANRQRRPVAYEVEDCRSFCGRAPRGSATAAGPLSVGSALGVCVAGLAGTCSCALGGFTGPCSGWLPSRSALATRPCMCCW